MPQETNQLTGCLAGWLLSWLAGWLADWSTGWFSACCLGDGSEHGIELTGTGGRRGITGNQSAWD